MNKKILTVILIIIFVLILILLNIFLNSQSNLDSLQKTNEISKEEEENEMEILKVTSESFESEVLKSEKVVLIDFYATWCGPCRMLSPIIEEIAKENEEIKVVKVDIDDEQALATKYKVMSIPTMVVIKNGEEINRKVGLVDKSEIMNMIK